MTDKVAGGDPSSTCELTNANKQKYQYSQLIKTEDKLLQKLIAFSLS
jgi:hypothetical protein